MCMKWKSKLMSYRPRSGRCSGGRARFWFVALSIALSCVLATAQTLTPGQQHQRPHRADIAPPAPDSDAVIPSPAGEEVGEDDVVRVDTQLMAIIPSR